MRMTHLHTDAQAPRRRAVNLTVDSALLEEARALDIPLSATLESALRQRVRAERQRRWLEENKGSIEDYNERVAREGTFGAGFGNI